MLATLSKLPADLFIHLDFVALIYFICIQFQNPTLNNYQLRCTLENK